MGEQFKLLRSENLDGNAPVAGEKSYTKKTKENFLYLCLSVKFSDRME